jgi:hypothetical protein
VVGQRLAAETAERGSVVAKKANKHWIGIAVDAKTRRVMALHVGIAVGNVEHSSGPKSLGYINSRRYSTRIYLGSIRA